MRLLKTLLVLALATMVAMVPVAAQETPSITVNPQGTDGQTIEIQEATIDEQGWIVIHPEGDPGEPDASRVLGTRMIEDGEHNNVDVELANELLQNQSLYAMLHYDDPQDGNFTFLSSGDPPVTVNNSTVVQDFYVVTIPGSAGNRLAEAEQQRIEEQRRADELEEERQQEQQEQEELRNEIDRLEEQLNESNGSTNGGGNGLPGFGPLLALTALVAAYLMFRRR